ncbi:baseplate J/gp47 family protein [Bacteroides sp.]|uniref:baseplate J/gp47 family protein n=1 Tax=Bacteroides sp. TaxID=29523 RepID=UPI002604EE7F|nr:baseplate J/gp47 family protein [Bacteroides sp.]MDD3039000.1 baseplate J/gp47 family protein [Bacteroides sp.]
MTSAGITPKGFIKKTYPEILQDYKTTAESIYGFPIDIAEYTPQGQLIQVFAYQNALMWDLLESVYYAGYIGTSSGDSLEYLVALIGNQRRPAMRSRGTATFFGNPNIAVPKHTKIHDEYNLIEFTTDHAITIPSSGEINVPITSTKYGYDQNISAGILTKTFPSSADFAVYNFNPTTGGRDLETDIQLRERSLVGTTHTAYATPGSILANIRADPGVEYADIEEDIPNNKFTIHYTGTTTEDKIQTLIAERKSAGIEYTISQLIDAIVTIQGAIKLMDQVDELQTIEDIKTEIANYIEPLKRGETLSWSGLYRHLSKTVNGLRDVESLIINSSEHETAITEFGQELEIVAGIKFKHGTSILWIDSKTEDVTVTVIATSDTLSDIELDDLLQTLIESIITNHPLNEPLSWTDFIDTLTDHEDISSVNYLKLQSTTEYADHPGTSVPSQQSYKFLPGTITTDTATIVPVSVTMKILINDTLILPSLPNAGNPLINHFWTLEKNEPFAYTDLQLLLPLIETSDPKINSLYSISLTGNSVTITPAAGTIPCDTDELLKITEPITIYTGFKTDVTITTAIKRTNSSVNITTLAQTVTETIQNHFKTKSPGDTLTYNEIINILTPLSGVSQILSLTIHTNTSPYGITEPGSSLIIQPTHFAVPTQIIRSIHDTLQVSVVVEATKTSSSILDEQIDTLLTSRITGYLQSLNSPSTPPLTWTGMKTTLLHDTELISDIPSLTITAGDSTLTGSTHSKTLSSIDYVIPGTYTITTTPTV